jgi:hypothetical protein
VIGMETWLLRRLGHEDSSVAHIAANIGGFWGLRM